MLANVATLYNAAGLRSPAPFWEEGRRSVDGSMYTTQPRKRDRAANERNAQSMNRIVVLAVSVVVVLVVAAPTAFADRTQSPPYPIDETPVILPATGDPNAIPNLSCEFPVSFFNSGMEKVVEKPVQSASSFAIIEAGRQTTLTNLDTGKQVTLNVTGTLQTGGVKDEPNLFKDTFTGANLVGTEETGFVLLEGHFTRIAMQDADGNFILVQPLTGEGQITDVCELLS
jgi:hypothetical protein